MLEFDGMFDGGEWDNPCSVTSELVVFIWASHTDQEPWSAMPLDDRTGYLRVVVNELLDLSDGIDSASRRHRLVEVSRRHGAFRRGQACPELVVAQDFAVLREAVREALTLAGASPRTVREATRSLLPDWRMTRRAALLGFVGV